MGISTLLVAYSEIGSEVNSLLAQVLKEGDVSKHIYFETLPPSLNR